MADNLNATCPICGKKYHRCGQCSSFKAWKAIADTYEHYQVAMILTEYREGISDARESREKFRNIGITKNTDFSEYLDAVSRDMKKIISEGNGYKPKPKIYRGLSEE
jgi:hypothetical protein